MRVYALATARRQVREYMHVYVCVYMMKCKVDMCLKVGENQLE